MTEQKVAHDDNVVTRRSRRSSVSCERAWSIGELELSSARKADDIGAVLAQVRDHQDVVHNWKVSKARCVKDVAVDDGDSLGPSRLEFAHSIGNGTIEALPRSPDDAGPVARSPLCNVVVVADNRHRTMARRPDHTFGEVPGQFSSSLGTESCGEADLCLGEGLHRNECDVGAGKILLLAFPAGGIAH